MGCKRPNTPSEYDEETSRTSPLCLSNCASNSRRASTPRLSPSSSSAKRPRQRLSRHHRKWPHRWTEDRPPATTATGSNHPGIWRWPEGHRSTPASGSWPPASAAASPASNFAPFSRLHPRRHSPRRRRSATPHLRVTGRRVQHGLPKDEPLLHEMGIRRTHRYIDGESRSFLHTL